MESVFVSNGSPVVRFLYPCPHAGLLGSWLPPLQKKAHLPSAAPLPSGMHILHVPLPDLPCSCRAQPEPLIPGFAKLTTSLAAPPAALKRRDKFSLHFIPGNHKCASTAYWPCAFVDSNCKVVHLPCQQHWDSRTTPPAGNRSTRELFLIDA